jgi:hypothetical protein
MLRPLRLIAIAASAATIIAISGCACARLDKGGLPSAGTPSTPSTPAAAVVPTLSPSPDLTASAGAGAVPTATGSGATPPPSDASNPNPGDEPAQKPHVSPGSKKDAKTLGGTSHKGETLFFIVGDSYDTEVAARRALKKARPRFGDMQDYFIVQYSDNFDGIRPGLWIVVEAYESADNARNQLEFAQRAFEFAHITRATVRTADPIPVYEDLVN